MSINQASIDLIKEFEGYRSKAYRDPVGIWTIGYGHTSAAGAPKVHEGLSISKAEAEDILRADLSQYERAVDRAIERPMTENQRGAFVSLCYNIGPGAFTRSTAVRRFNAGDVSGAAEAMTWFKKAGGKVYPGLVRRREAERKLFLTSAPNTVEEASVTLSAPVTGGEAKPIAQQKTTWLGGLTFAGALATIKDVRASVPEVAEYLPYALACVGVAIIVNRLIESRRGEH